MNDESPALKPILTVHSPKSLGPLKVWLSDRKYNNIFPYLTDRLGRRMIGLNWKYDDGTYDRCGLVVLDDLNLLAEVVGLCEEAMSHD